MEAEQALIGCALVSSQAMETAASAVGTNDFYRSEHRGIFGAMLALHRRGELADIVTTVAELGRQLEQVGGAGYIAGLTDVIPSTAAVSSYIKIVRDDAERRRLLALASELSARCQKREDPGDLAEFIRRTADDAADKRSTRPVVPITINDFLAREFPPRTSLLAPWLPTQGLIMIYAYRGVGKTHFALGVACACASAVCISDGKHRQPWAFCTSMERCQARSCKNG